MRCGLRISDATKLAFDCLACDADGAPYLRYYNHKMRREALVPIDAELHDQIRGQQQRLASGRPAGPPVLFPAR
jgi:integrase